jgi:hypothetical protein
MKNEKHTFSKKSPTGSHISAPGKARESKTKIEEWGKKRFFKK